MAKPKQQIVLSESSQNILIVASGKTAKTIGELLSRAGYECVAVSPTSRLAGRSTPVDVLASVSMVIADDNVDLNRLIENYRKRTSNDLPTLIVITDAGSAARIRALMRQGVADVISKSIQESELLQAVKRALSSGTHNLRVQLRRSQVRVTELLLEAEQRNRNLLSFIDTATNLLAFVDNDERIIICNDCVRSYFGVDREDLIGKPLDHLLVKARTHFESAADFDSLIARLRKNPDGELEDSKGHREYLARALRTNSEKEQFIGIFSLEIQSGETGSGGRLWGMSDITDIKQAEEQLRIVVDASPIPLVVTRVSDGRIIYANKLLGEMMGQPAEELIGKKSPDFYFDPEDRKIVLQDLETAGESHREIRLKSREGNIIWSIFSLVTTEIAGEAVIIGGLYDITQRRKMEEDLRRERNFISAVLRTAGALVVVLDTQGRIVQFNRECEQVSGYRADQAMGKCVWDFLLPAEAVEPIKKAFSDIKSGVFTGTIENYWITRSGNKRLIEWKNTELLKQGGEVEFVIATGIDITEKRAAEDALLDAHAELERRVERRTQQLARSEALNRAMIEALPDVIFRFDSDGVCLDVHAPEGSPFYGSTDQLIGQKPTEFLPAQAAKYLMAEVLEAKLTGAIRVAEYSLPFNGSVRHIESRLIPYGNDEVMAIGRDVTDKVEAQQALQRAHDELEQRVADRTRELAGVNDALREEVTERRLAQVELSSRLRYEAALSACSKALISESEFDIALEKILANLRSASDASTAYIFENFEDPHAGLCCRLLKFDCDNDELAPHGEGWNPDRIPYQGLLTRWRKVLSQGEPIKGTTADLPQVEREYFEPYGVKAILAIPIFVDQAWHGFIGFEDTAEERSWKEDDVRALHTAGEMLGVFIARKRAEDALRISEVRFRNIVENANDIILLLDRNGRLSYVSPNWKAQLGHSEEEILGRPLLDFVHPGDIVECRNCLREMLETLERQNGLEYRVRHRGGEWRWHEMSISPMTAEDGELISYVCVSHDVTEQRRTLDELAEAYRDLSQTQGQLIQSEKMASLGMLVAGIAHEINTPTGAVVSMHNTLVRALGRLKSQLEIHCKEPASQEELSATMQVIDEANKVIVSGTDRVTNIVRRLRSFARLDEAESKTVDIHDGLEDTLTLIYHEIKHDIEIVRDFGELTQISCYPGRLNQVFLNLLINAKQAISGKGTITIRTWGESDAVNVEISDTGVGIPGDHLARIFDPGFTTKGVGVGTGLGLSICYQIVQDHEGSLTVHSKEGEGTGFQAKTPNPSEF